MSSRWLDFLSQPSGGDLGQDGSDDTLSGTHGLPLASDYQDEGELTLSLSVTAFPVALSASCHFVPSNGFSDLQKASTCFVVVLIPLGNSVLPQVNIFRETLIPGGRHHYWSLYKTVAHKVWGHLKTTGPSYFHPFRSFGFTETHESWDPCSQKIGIFETFEPVCGVIAPELTHFWLKLVLFKRKANELNANLPHSINFIWIFVR